MASLQLSLIIMCAKGPVKATKASLAASALSFTSTIALLVLSMYEFTHSIKPSSQITLYLLYSIASTSVQTRTLWLIAGMKAMASLTTLTLLLQLMILILESRSKIKLLEAKFGPYPPEAVKVVFNRSVFWWLNSMLWFGFRTDIQIENLFPTDPYFSSQTINSAFHSLWVNCM